MYKLLVLSLALCTDAFGIKKANLPTPVARTTAPSMEMRYGKSQVKIRQKMNRLLLEADTIEEVAEILQHDNMDKANRRMFKHLACFRRPLSQTGFAA